MLRYTTTLVGLLLLTPLPGQTAPDTPAQAADSGQSTDATGTRPPAAGSANSKASDQPEATGKPDAKPKDKGANKPGAKVGAAAEPAAAVPSAPQVVTPADAKAATDAATAYLTALKEKGFAAAPGFLHPDAMARFKALVVPGLKDDQARGARALLNATFGREANYVGAASTAPAEFFTRFARLIAAREPDAAPRFSGLTPLGVVREGEQLHVLVRLSQVGGAGSGAVERVEVVSLLPQGAEWKVLLDGRLQDLAYRLGSRAGADDHRAMPARMEPVPEGLPLIQSEPAGPAGIRPPPLVPSAPSTGSGAVSPPYVMPDAPPQRSPRVRAPTD